jgi:response regulator RpfG family c-di-GMP phosphodiesterase
MDERTRNILYIDDEEANLRALDGVLRKKYNIFLAKSGKEGLAILKKKKIDLIITDQRMPGMTGVQFLKEVKNKYPDVQIPRIVISGFSQDQDILEAFEKYDLYKFVSKPWDINELRDLVDSTIGVII